MFVLAFFLAFTPFYLGLVVSSVCLVKKLIDVFFSFFMFGVRASSCAIFMVLLSCLDLTRFGELCRLLADKIYM